MKLLIMQFSPAPSYFIPLKSKNSQHSTLSLCFSLNVRQQVLYPYKTTRKIIVFYILYVCRCQTLNRIVAELVVVQLNLILISP
jgi:hypothetical protein